MELPLRLGPLTAEGFSVHRSGVRWLCEPGQWVGPHQAIAYFNLSLEPTGRRSGATPPFGDERELQVVCAPRVGGRIQYDASASPGGYLSILRVDHWEPGLELARLQVDDPADAAAPHADQLRLLLLAGRRMTPLVDVHSGLLPGWNGRSRAWWSERGETPITLLSLGICDITGVVQGERCAFLEMFATETAPTQFVFFPDHPIAPAAPVLLDQLERTPADFRAISADLHTAIAKGGVVPTADDWMFAGTMLTALERSPLRESYDLLTADGLKRSKPAEAVLLSLHSEAPDILRHKTLGYHLHILRHHQTAAGPALKHWWSTAFEPVRRTVDDIRADYVKLLNAIKKTTGARVLVFNRMSTYGDEDIATYAPFDAPLSSTLANVAAKELNLMVHDLAAEYNIGMIDVDAIAADIGGAEHLPDGIHQSKALQEILREEILLALSDLRPKSPQTQPS